MIAARLFRRGRRRSIEAEPPEAGPEILFAELSRVRIGLPYGGDDRRRDFHNVFFGNDAGKRVLYEILAWSHVFASTFVPGDPYASHWREGGRDVGLRILAVLNPDPPVPSAGSGAAVEADSRRGAQS